MNLLWISADLDPLQVEVLTFIREVMSQPGLPQILPARKVVDCSTVSVGKQRTDPGVRLPLWKAIVKEQPLLPKVPSGVSCALDPNRRVDPDAPPVPEVLWNPFRV